MEQVDQFIAALEEWNDLFEEEMVNDLNSVVIHLLYSLGDYEKLSRTVSLDDLKKKIVNLVHENNFVEDFLIMSCVEEVSRILERSIKQHGELILMHERMLDNLEDRDKAKSDLVSSTLEKLRDPSYINKTKSEYYCWQKIIITKKLLC